MVVFCDTKKVLLHLLYGKSSDKLRQIVSGKRGFVFPFSFATFVLLLVRFCCVVQFWFANHKQNKLEARRLAGKETNLRRRPTIYITSRLAACVLLVTAWLQHTNN